MEFLINTLEIFGAIAIAIGVGISFGLGAGLIAGGVITVAYLEIPQYLADRK
jgi:hypothetical protein